MLDLFLILLLLLCVVGMILKDRNLSGSHESEQTQEFVITLCSRAVDASVLECIEVGESVYGKDGQPIGRVLEVASAAQPVTLIRDGKVYVGEWDRQRLCRVQLRVYTQGTVRDGVFLLLGRIPLPLGGTMILKGAYTEMEYQMQKVEPSASS